MKKLIILLLVLCVSAALFAQETEEQESFQSIDSIDQEEAANYGYDLENSEYGSTITTGRNASLGVEATTGFVWDLDNKSSGLETKIGLELIFDLFPALERGAEPPNNFNNPFVRLIIKDAAFTWWNTYSTRGGNYEQDDFNSWQARPLILTFDTIIADLVWRNFFFRVGSSTTIMQTDTVSLRSIFDDVMDVNDRFYYSENQALWSRDRYNIQRFPLLGNRIRRNFTDIDYRDHISGILAGGVEYSNFSATLKTASYANGLENDENAWLFGADIEAVPIPNLKFEFTGFAGVNYDKVINENPMSFGILGQYRLNLTEDIILNPFTGFDFNYDTAAKESEWEIGAGVMLYTRGYDTLSYRVLDFDDVIPAGASLSMNIDHDSRMNVMLSWFDPPGRYSMIENFGGFLQLELADLTQKDGDMLFGVLGQAEYTILGIFTPYIRGGYKSEIQGSTVTGNYIISAAAGVYLTPVHFFSMDLFYSSHHLLTKNDLETNMGTINAIFTIRM